MSENPLNFGPKEKDVVSKCEVGGDVLLGRNVVCFCFCFHINLQPGMSTIDMNLNNILRLLVFFHLPRLQLAIDVALSAVPHNFCL